jgi:hypothetical protein
MANLNQRHNPASQEIIFDQLTVDSLKNNTLMIDFYTLGEKILEEGYSLIFRDYDGTPRAIESPTHLKNYINNISGFKHI